MKKIDMNSLMTGYKVMTAFQGTGQTKCHCVRGVLCAIVAVLILMGFAAPAFAQGIGAIGAGGVYNVDDEDELDAAINDTPFQNKIINFQRSIGVQNPKTYTLANGETLTLRLNGYNFEGNGYVEFIPASGHANLEIEGSYSTFNSGLRLHGDIKLTYKGLYTSSENDFIGDLSGDKVEVDLTTPGSGWDAYGKDVTIGKEGDGIFRIANGNWGQSRNLIIGSETGSKGLMEISGTGWHHVRYSDGSRDELRPTTWTNTGNTIVGDDGNGTLLLHSGALLQTGNFAVGAQNPSPSGVATGGTGTGVASIWGAGTVLDIMGSHDTEPTYTSGTAEMNVSQRAQVYLHYNDKLHNSTTTQYGWANLVHGVGNSSFDNSYFQTDRGVINGPDNNILFTNGALFEGSTYGFFKDDTDPATGFGSRGNITLNSLSFDGNAVFSPGFGNQALWNRDLTAHPIDLSSQKEMVWLYELGKNARAFDETGAIYTDSRGYPLPVGRYGQIEMDGNFNLRSGGLMIFDFDIEGDTNHANASAQTLQHKDYVDMIGGAATLNGSVHFRPMTGYYQDNVTIDFMSAAGGNPILTLWPKRWFENAAINGGTLNMERHQTPFQTSGISYNEKSVGVALDFIYNEEQKAHVDDLMVDQEASEWFPVLDWFWGMGDDDFRKAMRQLSGETRAASFYMPLRSPWRFAFERVNWRKRDNHVYFGQQNILAPYVAKQDIWVTPYYDYMHMGDDGNTSSAYTTRVSFMAGYDRAFSKYAAGGFIFGYSQPKLEQVYSRVIADDYLFGLHYDTRVANDFELKLWSSYGVQHYRLSRNVPIRGGEDIHARYKGNSATASIQVARPYSFWKGVIRPLAALDYSFVKQDEAEEDGYMPIKLRYAASDWSQLFGRIGVRGDFGWKRISLTSSLSYSYLVAGDVAPAASNQFIYGDRYPGNPIFDIKGPDLSRTFINVGLGSQIYLNRLKSRMFFVQYNGNYGKRTNAQNASIGYQMTF